VFAKTGSAGVFPEGRPEFLAVRLAAEELNAAGGLLGHPVEVVEYDDQSTALGSRQAAEEAIKAGVIAVIGATRSSHSLGMAPVLQSAGIPMITPVSTDPQVTLTGHYIFRVCFIDDFQGEAMASFAAEHLGAKRAVVLTNTGESFSMSLAKFFMARFRRLGGTVLWEGDYLGSATDFTGLLVRVRELNPDVCFVPGYDADTGFIIRQARIMGIRTVFLSGDGLSENIYTYAGGHADGTYFSSHWHPESTDPRSRTFVRAFEKKHGKIKEASPALTYDAVKLLADSVRRANSLDRARIRDALAATKGFRGVTGEITFDRDRNPRKRIAVILKLEKGRSVYVKGIEP
jgi:branched-chain amino acid transport system substrate-binding protein